jgi:branched-chain amino acid transport system ATP-binding protein
MNMKLLSIKNVTAGYGDAMVLNNISLHVDEGEVVSIVGANGAGKSTLLSTLSGLVTTTQGEIWMGDQRIENLAPHRIVELQQLAKSLNILKEAP